MKAFFAVLTALVCLVMPLLGGSSVLSAAASCDVKIIELATSGMPSQSGNGIESQDMIMVKNLSPTTSASVRLLYYQSNGVSAESLSFSLGSIPAGGVRSYVSPDLAELNPAATLSKTLALSSAGGAVRIEKSSGGAHCDMLGWGDSVLAEGDAAPVSGPGQTLFRLSEDDHFVDTDDNARDFQILQNTCAAPLFREIQPYVSDESGGAVEAWAEIVGDGVRDGDCLLLTAEGSIYLVPSADLPEQGEASVINRGISDSGIIPLQFGESGGHLRFAWSSMYVAEAPVYLPLSSMEYPALLRGQTWSLIDDLWRPTYAPTPGQANIFQPVPKDQPIADNSCSAVRISEVLSNPDGEDSDNEWVELQNTANQTVMLRHCQIVFEGVSYGFSDFDGLKANELRTFSTFSDSDGSSRALKLRNSSDVPLLMSWEQQIGENLSEVVQSFYLYDGEDYDSAPDGQSWARFEDGWRWTEALTPNAPNLKELPKQNTVPTEFAVRSASTGAAVSMVSTLPSSGPPLRITELLPDPASPAKDDTDEYVEIYNPNSVPVDVTGYILQTGSTYNYRYTFPRQTIAPGAYLVITSGATSISLSNTAGQARLLDRAGRVVSQTDAYTKAPEGAAWAYVDGGWKWTGSPTRGTANRYAPVIGSISAAAKKAAAKKTAAEKAASTGVVKSSSTEDQKDGATAQDESTEPASVHGVILAAVGLLGVLYAAYEYRTDIANKIHKLRSNRATWRANRKQPKGR